MVRPELVAWTLIAATLPFAIAIVVSLRPISRPKGVDDYFIFGGRLSPSLYLKSSVGYSLQVAAIFLFLLWYFAYGVSALIVPTAWFGGFVVVWVAVRAKSLDDFLGSADRRGGRTIHGFVGHLARSRPLVIVMALTTIFGVAGTLIGELDYSTKFLAPALGLEYASKSTLIGHGAILFFSASYVLWGGFRASVFTDAIQVPVAYASFVAVVLAVCYQAAKAGAAKEGLIIVGIVAVLLLTFWRNREKLRKVEPTYPVGRDRMLFLSLLILCAFTAFSMLSFEHQESHRVIQWRVNLLNPLDPSTFLGFGLFGAISLTLTNVVWQLVDITNLQRLQAVSAAGMARGEDGKEETEQDRETCRTAVMGGLVASGVESAGSWVLTFALAMAAQLAGLTLSSPAGLASFLVSGSLFPSWILPVFAFAVVTFMLSTLSGLISAIAYVSYHDIAPALSGDSDRKNSDLTLPRATTLLSLTTVYVLYIMLRNAVGDRTEAVIYAVYAVQMSAGLVILMALFRPSAVRPWAAILSVLVGWAGAVWSAQASTPAFGIPVDSWYVIPPLVAFIVSVVAYLTVAAVGAALPRRSSSARTVG